MEERLERLWAAYDRELIHLELYQSMLQGSFNKIGAKTATQQDFEDMIDITNAIEATVRTVSDLRREATQIEAEVRKHDQA